ncbi:unnamed protein product [Sphagnum balticum]
MDADGRRRRQFSGSPILASSSSSFFNRRNAPPPPLPLRVQPYVPEPVHDPPLPGMIFGCTTETYQECMARQLFGLPERNKNQVLRVVPGSKLFLFNYRVKEMSGIFEATCHGGMNIVRDAFNGWFPAQVKIQCISVCPNLPASVFKGAILDNYFDNSKFKYDLTAIQVGRLTELFKMKAEYVARHLATVDYHYIHYRQNLQELKYEQPQLQPRNSRKRIATEAIEGMAPEEISESAICGGSATTSHRCKPVPIMRVSTSTRHRDLEQSGSPGSPLQSQISHRRQLRKKEAEC